MLRIIALTLALTTLSACKVAVLLVEGGEVQSTGSGTCLISPTNPQTGTVCIHEVADTSYSETFTAVPDAGWEFVRWNSGDGFLCEDSNAPTCVVSNVLLAGNVYAEAIVASDATFYLMPVFSSLAAVPITDTITADGKEWAQVDLFVNLSWNEINAVCPAGVCADGGQLNGFNMAGWTLASVDDVNSLFNSYIGAPELGPGPDNFLDLVATITWIDIFFNVDGWRPTTIGADIILARGFSSTSVLGDPSAAHMPGISAVAIVGGAAQSAATNGQISKDTSADNIGAWFYR